MSGVSTVRTLVTQLGQVVGIEQLELDEEGAAAVEVDDFVTDLQAYEDAEVLLAAIDLGPLPPVSCQEKLPCRSRRMAAASLPGGSGPRSIAASSTSASSQA